MSKRKNARVQILEGIWWSNHEVPLVLPYFHALSVTPRVIDDTHRTIDISHRTIRGIEDIAYYVSKIPKGAAQMLYFACHAENGELMPAGKRHKIPQDALLDALSKAKEGAVSFIHFGCCEMIDPGHRRMTHEEIMNAVGAKWTSGYTKDVYWLRSMLLDLALVTEVFAPQYGITDGRKASLKRNASKFVTAYEQLARDLGFSAALSKVAGGADLFPKRLHT